MRKSAASVFGEMTEAMLGMRVREDDEDDDDDEDDEDEDEDEDEEGDGILKYNRKRGSMSIKKTKKRGSGWSYTLGPYIEKVRAE